MINWEGTLFLKTIVSKSYNKADILQELEKEIGGR